MGLTIEHYRTHIAPLINACADRHCTSYWHVMRKTPEEEVTDEDKKQILILFNNVVSYMLVAHSPNEPFKAIMYLGDGRRTAIPSDLSTAQRDYLQTVLPEITDEELKARVADVLWVLRHGKASEHAEVAIPAYITSAMKLREKHWPRTHGLMDDDQLFSMEVVYLYWLTLHIIFLPAVRAEEPPQENVAFT